MTNAVATRPLDVTRDCPSPSRAQLLQGCHVKYDSNSMTLAPPHALLPNSSEYFIKPAHKSDHRQDPSEAEILLQEITVLEYIRRQPGPEHPNIAKYHGVVVLDLEGNQVVTGLCFTKYRDTLDTVSQLFPLWPGEGGIRDGVLAGIKYLHSIGLVHNDINEDNIMVTIEDGSRPVIIDFGSCWWIGKQTGRKKGVRTYAAAEEKNDFEGWNEIEDRLWHLYELQYY